MHDHHAHEGFHESVMEGVDPLSMEVFRAFRKAMHLQKQLFTRHLASSGAHPGQMVCLWALTDEGMTQRDLAERLHLARPTVTVMLQKMERAGLIERAVDEADQRYTRITLTDAGRRMRDETKQINVRIFSETIGRLDPSDQRELLRVLGMLGDHAEDALKTLASEPYETDSAGRGAEAEGAE